MKSVIVIGGSGYIGRECVAQLLDKGYKVINIDKNPIYEALHKNFYDIEFDLRNEFNLYSDLLNYLNGDVVQSVICFAAFKDLSESYEVPFEYYNNNLKVLLNSIEIAHRLQSKTFIFSSSAAVYNDEGLITTTEASPTQAPSPYGFTKLVGERIAIDSCNQYNIRCYCLRYFNPIGSTFSTKDDSESLFGNIKKCLNNNSELKIFGSNYESKDGTCIRDYIHIEDLVDAHIFCMSELPSKGSFVEILNVGTGLGTTVLEVCKTVQELIPRFKYSFAERRQGDVVGSYADVTRIKSYGWKPRFTIKDAIKSFIDH